MALSTSREMRCYWPREQTPWEKRWKANLRDVQNHSENHEQQDQLRKSFLHPQTYERQDPQKQTKLRSPDRNPKFQPHNNPNAQHLKAAITGGSYTTNACPSHAHLTAWKSMFPIWPARAWDNKIPSGKWRLSASPFLHWEGQCPCPIENNRRVG